MSLDRHGTETVSYMARKYVNGNQNAIAALARNICILLDLLMLLSYLYLALLRF